MFLNRELRSTFLERGTRSYSTFLAACDVLLPSTIPAACDVVRTTEVLIDSTILPPALSLSLSLNAGVRMYACERVSVHRACSEMEKEKKRQAADRAVRKLALCGRLAVIGCQSRADKDSL